MEVLVREGQTVEPLDVAIAAECRRLLPSDYNLRWADMRSIVHNCTWFLCDLLVKLSSSQHMMTLNMSAALYDAFHKLVSVACKFADDVCTTAVFCYYY